MSDRHVARLLAAFAKMPHPLSATYIETMVADTLPDVTPVQRVAAFVKATEIYEQEAATAAAGFLAAWEPNGRPQ